MSSIIDDIAAAMSPLFRFGMPLEVRRKIIPVRTAAHFIAFEPETVGPLFTMHRILETTEAKKVERHDNFISEFCLPATLRTTASDYSAWNKANPDNPMDIGHQTGSQFRRSTFLDQHDVDSLAGCCPETPGMNRHIKGHIETSIQKRAGSVDDKGRRIWLEVYSAQGPWFCNDVKDSQRPRLQSGQWIPDGAWISTLWRGRSKLEVRNWSMRNVQDWTTNASKLISLKELQDLTARAPYSGLRLWGGVDDSNLDRDKILETGW